MKAQHQEDWLKEAKEALSPSTCSDLAACARWTGSRRSTGQAKDARRFEDSCATGAYALPRHVVFDSSRVGRDAGRIADEVVAHLVGLVRSDVVVTLEIEARVPAGVPESVVRVVTENGRTLKFSSQGFERE